MYSKPGTACNDYTGYCDVFQKCREVRDKIKIWSWRGLLVEEGCRVGLGVARVGVRMSWGHGALPA